MRILKTYFILLLILFGTKLFAQINILEQNEELINRLANFETVYEVDSNFIKYQTKETYGINSGYGVATKKYGNIIFPVQKDISSFIKAYSNYITLVKLSNYEKSKFGLINNKGEIILDFKYDRIGNVFVDLPDSLITVQLGDKFGVFNTNTQTLSAIKYNNTDNVLNDGYAYHEGGGSKAKKEIYNQLGLEIYFTPPISMPYEEIKAKIVANDSVAYLVNKKGEKISKNYDTDLEKLYQTHPHEFYIGGLKDVESKYENARKLFLLNGVGKEIAQISSHQNKANEHYITLLPNKSYYFIKTAKIAVVPDNYEEFVICYAGEGFIGFKNKVSNQKLFVDEFGNQKTIGTPTVDKTKVITQQLSNDEIVNFKNLTTQNNYLGRVTKYLYHANGKLQKETGFDFDGDGGSGNGKLSWESTYYYDVLDSLEKVQYYDGQEIREENFHEDIDNHQKTFNAKKQLIKSVFDNGVRKFEERFIYDKSGKLIESINLDNDEISLTMRYQYNAKNLLVKETSYQDNHPNYTYISTYDDDNRKIKYDMINVKGKSTGIWIYQYNSKNQLIYKIDLYGLEEEQKIIDVEEVAPGPPLPSNN